MEYTQKVEVLNVIQKVEYNFLKFLNRGILIAPDTY